MATWWTEAERERVIARAVECGRIPGDEVALRSWRATLARDPAGVAARIEALPQWRWRSPVAALEQDARAAELRDAARRNSEALRARLAGSDDDAVFDALFARPEPAGLSADDEEFYDRLFRPAPPAPLEGGERDLYEAVFGKGEA